MSEVSDFYLFTWLSVPHLLWLLSSFLSISNIEQKSPCIYL